MRRTGIYTRAGTHINTRTHTHAQLLMQERDRCPKGSCRWALLTHIIGLQCVAGGHRINFEAGKEAFTRMHIWVSTIINRDKLVDKQKVWQRERERDEREVLP